MTLSTRQIKTLSTLLENSDNETSKERYDFLKLIANEIKTLQEVEKTNAIANGEAKLVSKVRWNAPNVAHWRAKHPQSCEKHCTSTTFQTTVWR
jgi:hypothetical protein